MKIKFYSILPILGLLVLMNMNSHEVLAQSKAHDYSQFAIIDPVYSPESNWPESNIIAGKSSWIYGPSELECWRLQLLQERKDSAQLIVGYSGVFHKMSYLR